MALQPQVLELPFGVGLQERVRDELKDPQQSAITLVNVAQDKRGGWGKRSGFSGLTAAIVGGGTLANGRRGGARNKGAGTWLIADALANGTSNAHQLYDYSPQQTAWVPRGKVPECVVRQQTVVSNGGSWVNSSSVNNFNATFDIMETNGIRVISWSQTNEAATTASLYYQVQDAVTGATLTPATQLASFASGNAQWAHKLMSCGNRVWIAYVIATAGDIQLAYIDTTTSTLTFTLGNLVSSYVTALSGSVPNGNFAAFSGPNCWGIMVKTATNIIYALLFTNAGIPYGLTLQVTVANANFFPVAIAADANTLWTTYIDVTNNPCLYNTNAWGTLPTLTSLGTINSSAIPKGTQTQASGVLIPQSATSALLAFTYAILGDVNAQARVVGYAIAGGAVTTTTTNYWPLIAFVGGPIYQDGVPYMLAVPGVPGGAPGPQLTYNAQTATVHLVDISAPDATFPPLRPVATMSPGLYLFQAPLYFTVPNIVSVGGGKFHGLIGTKKNGAAYGLDLIEFDFSFTNRWQSIEFADETNFATGVVTVYDGATVQESNWLHPPIVGSLSNAAGGIPAGTYQFTAIYEYVDAAGNVHWSAPAAPQSITLAVAGSITLTVSPCQITMRASSRIALYMTTSLGQILYRVKLAQQQGASLPIAFTIVAAPFGTEAQLYTSPGTPGTSLPRQAPPGLTCITQHNGGICGVAPNGHEIWFSSQHVTGEAVWWNPFFIAQVEDANPVVALASCEGRLYAFTRRNIWIIDGQGFVDNGLGGYSPPQLLPTDCGCVEPRSLVVTAEGCFFKSDLGIMLLDRSSQVSWVGEPVAATLATYPVVTSAVLDPVKHLVLFSLSSSEINGLGATPPGRWLVFDFVSHVWSTWDVQFIVGTHQAAQAAWMQGLLYYWVSYGGYVSTETPASYVDGVGWITMQVEAGNIKMGGLQGYQRVWRVLLQIASVTACDLTIDFAFDDSPTYTETRTFTAAQLATLSFKQVEHVLKNQKCSSLRMRVTDATPTGGPAVGTGQGCTLLGHHYAYGVNPRKPVAQVAR